MNFLSNIRFSEYARNSFTLILGTGFSQLIPIMLQPFLRRMYSDEEFGLFAQFFSLASVLMIFSSLKYANSIILPKEDRKAIHIIVGALFLNLLTSTLLLLVCFFFGSNLIDFFGLSIELKKYILLLPASVFLLGSNEIFTYWLIRKKKYKGLSFNKTLRRFSEGVSQFALFKPFQKGGLIIGSLIGDFVNLIMFVYQFFKSRGSFKQINKFEIASNLKEQIDFPKFYLLPSLLNTFSLHIIVFMIAAFYNQSSVGQLDASRQLLALPLALISTSISQVLLQKMTEKNNQSEPILPLVIQNLKFLVILAVLGIILFFFFGTYIFELIFGENWTEAGKLSSILIFSYAIKFVVSPLSSVFIALKKLKISAIWQLFYFILICSLLLFKDLSFKEFIQIYVVFEVVAYMFYGILIFRTIKRYEVLKNN